jgi:FixJ family two-component response regulator
LRLSLSRSIGAGGPLLYPVMERLLTENSLISIVDDDDGIRGAIEALVRSLGLATRTFASAEAFLQSSSVAETRCLILDVHMPGMSGLELQDHLSRLGSEIPIIFITAYPDETIKARALSAGALCFLHKPIDLRGRRLVDCLYTALDRGKGTSPVS